VTFGRWELMVGAAVQGYRGEQDGDVSSSIEMSGRACRRERLSSLMWRVSRDGGAGTSAWAREIAAEVGCLVIYTRKRDTL